MGYLVPHFSNSYSISGSLTSHLPLPTSEEGRLRRYKKHFKL